MYSHWCWTRQQKLDSLITTHSVGNWSSRILALPMTSLCSLMAHLNLWGGYYLSWSSLLVSRGCISMLRNLLYLLRGRASLPCLMRLCKLGLQWVPCLLNIWACHSPPKLYLSRIASLYLKRCEADCFLGGTNVSPTWAGYNYLNQPSLV